MDDLFKGITDLKAACIFISELFNELVEVGMNKDDALTLLAKVLREGQGEDITKGEGNG